jgi:hypothetical protein
MEDLRCTLTENKPKLDCGSTVLPNPDRAMTVSPPSAPVPAVDTAHLVVTARKLVDRWRDRAAAMQRFAPAATTAWGSAADELEAHLNLSSRAEALPELIERLRAELADALDRILADEQSRYQNELPL